MFSNRVNHVRNLANAKLSCLTDTSVLSALRLDNQKKNIRQYHEVQGDIICPNIVKGIDYIKDPRLNKGLAFTLEERQILGIHGLQPARFKTQEEQLELCKISVSRYTENLNKYLYLSDLSDRNEKLFYRLLAENVEELMPIVYTPTVGLACQKFGLIYRRPRGLFVTIRDRHHVYDVLKNWPENDVRAICVTDGERILGLGDLGSCGMGIPVGKLALYTALAGIKPHKCLPIQIDVGTNNKDLLEDPLYVGLRQPRVTGAEYDEFIDEFMQAVVKRWGQHCLVQFEDFGISNAFRFLEKYRNLYCTFNDDIQGTAAVAVAGLYASERITKKKLSDHVYLFAGAGGASLGIADLTCKAMQLEGISIEEARSKIWMADIEGLLTTDRNVTPQQRVFAKSHEQLKSLEEIVNQIKPTVLVGASGAPNIFNEKILKTMAANNDRPIIFALSNPTTRAECTAESAYKNTDGRAIFSSGSPFGTVEHGSKVFKPGQGNNAYIFPGVALGVICTETHHIPDDMFLIAAQELAQFVRQEDLDAGSLYPPLSKIREVSMKIAIGITECAYAKGLAATYPEPTDKKKWLEEQLYSFNYECSLPITWNYPELPPIKTRKLEPTKLFDDKK